MMVSQACCTPHPPLPQVSLSGLNWFRFFGLQAMLAFKPLIPGGLRVKVGKQRGYGAGFGWVVGCWFWPLD